MSAELNLYSVQLQQPGQITHAIIGNFSGSKQQEIVVCRGGSSLELLKVNGQTGKMEIFLTHRVFAVVRSICAVRLTGSSKDYILVGSDSGRVVILEYDLQRNQLVKIHQETFGKSGCRRIIPGEHIAVDPKGRAFMIAATEKQKLVYVLNRDASNRLTISSPLEAHRSHTLVENLVSLDVGFENPIFASIEYDYHDADTDHTVENFDTSKKTLTFYELDLGLNHVIRKWSDSIDMSSNLLIPLPGGNDGPSGVLVCSEGFITWKNQNYTDIKLRIPSRANFQCWRKTLVVSYVVHKTKNFFFVLIQSELGDIFKITVDWTEDVIKDIKLSYFDTIAPSVSLCILKSGFLFSAPEVGNQFLYQIESLGEDDERTKHFCSSEIDDDIAEFLLHELKNLAPVDVSPSICPVVDAKIMNLTDEDTPQFYILSGRGAQSSLRVMRRGLEMNELVSYPLPGTPCGIWTLKSSSLDLYDSYIVISFLNATLVLSVGETIEEDTESGLDLNSQTLLVYQMGKESIVQVRPHGVRHITVKKSFIEWKCPPDCSIEFAVCNQSQLIIHLSSGRLVYFEHNDNGALGESHECPDFESQIKCIAIASVPEGRQRSRYMAVGFMDQTVKIFCLDSDNFMTSVTIQVLNSVPCSVLINRTVDFRAGEECFTDYLNVGLENGVIMRSVLDQISGEISDTKARYVGSRPIHLKKIKINEQDGFVAISSKTWISYTYQKRDYFSPISYETVDHVAVLSSEMFTNGLVSTFGNTLKILAFEQLGNEFNTAVIPLSYTPRQMTVDPVSRNLIIIEGDHDSMNASGDVEETRAEQFGREKAGLSKWSSCIRVLNPFTGETCQQIHFSENEMPLSVTSCIFHLDASSPYFVVGTVKDLQLPVKKFSACFLHLYRRNSDGQLILIHKTEVKGLPSAICPFQGRLLVSVGNLLRIYDLGKRKLLRKCETKVIPNQIVSLSTQGDRIIICDIQESVHFARYLYQENVIVVFADDPRPRWTTRCTMLDYNTVAISDKFGGFAVNRLPKDIADSIDEDVTGSKMIHEKDYLNGAPHRLECICEYYVGDIITSLQRSVMVAGGREVLVYITLGGAIGMFVPFNSREDMEFFRSLEWHMRTEFPSLCGRDHLAFRSYYAPVKNVIDGDLIEQYHHLSLEKRTKIAESLDRTPNDISKQIELIRDRVF